MKGLSAVQFGGTDYYYFAERNVNQMAQNLPYNDERMTYDYYDHRYVLTPDHVRNELNVDLESRLNTHGTANRATLAVSYLKRVSREIYNYIYAHNDQLLLEYICAKSETARRVICAAMEEQVLYWLANGDVGLMTGVDPKRGSYAEQKTVRRAMIAPNAEGLLETMIIPEISAPLIYTGHYAIFKALPAYDSEGY